MKFACQPGLGKKLQTLLGGEGGWTLREPFFDSIAEDLAVLAWLGWYVEICYG